MSNLLPIDLTIPHLRDALQSHTSVILQAPPGAGKTTRVPLALLDDGWLAGGKIVMLEPRRLAARAAAQRMASTLGEHVGETVGYRMRSGTRVGSRTRIEVVTEGVLTRMLSSDPSLDGVGLVIFDEFHERNLVADLGLALTVQSQGILRPDLRILVMSATLSVGPLASLLDDAPIVTSEGVSYPVETRYLDRPSDEKIEKVVAATVRRALAEEHGDVLVFLPGVAEIRRTVALLGDLVFDDRRLDDTQLRDPAKGGRHPSQLRVAPLYGDLPQEEQDRAIEPSPAGSRKVVLATSIAETSLTIEGIRVVIDSGLMRVPRFSPRSGMTRLATVRLSKASADQRRGRAGRLGPGICYRLWTEAEHGSLVAFTPPEILDADLVPLALDLAEWGVADPSELVWLDPPPAGAFAQARELLTELGGLDQSGAITPHGRRMATTPLHPRLAHMILTANEIGLGSLACTIAALLGERDILRSSGTSPDADLRLRLEALRSARDRDSDRRDALDRSLVQRIEREAERLRRSLDISARRDDDIEACGLLLAFAWPDRIGQPRSGDPGRFLLRNGAAAFLERHQSLARGEWLVAAELDGQRRESRIYLAAPVAIEEIVEHFAGDIIREEVVAWNGDAGRVQGLVRERLGALVIRETSLQNPDPALICVALIGAIEDEGLTMLLWSKGARSMQERINFMHRIDATWPDISDDVLSATLREWLGPHLLGIRRREELARLDLISILTERLDWKMRASLEELAPTHLVVPSGSRIPIDYSNPDAPVVGVRLQEMFGLAETPSVARGRIPLTIHLLSPAGRPVQVTRDLASFWRTAYFEVRKDLQGRYPKHYWPNDPMEATPTRRTRPR